MRAWIAGLAVIAVMAAAGCSGNSAERTATVTETVEVIEETVVEPAPAAENRPVEPASGPFPRVVTTAQVGLPAWAIEQMQAGSPFPRKAIEWAPGIYTRAAEPVGDLADYSTVYGPCPEAKRFIEGTPISLVCTT
jgi:hypothetical protein